MKWVWRILLLLVLGYFGWGVFDYYRAGLHTRPELPEGAWSVSYKSGFRAIMQGIGKKDKQRRYLGRPTKVPYYLEDVWSFCEPLSEEEVKDNLKNFKWMVGERFEAACFIDVEGEKVLRGFVTSVPNLK